MSWLRGRIPDGELAALEADAESALERGSGLGLWITKWAVQYLGGELTFESSESRGTTATVSVPRTASETVDASLKPLAAN
jgi:signal transduction histidine kinase